MRRTGFLALLSAAGLALAAGPAAAPPAIPQVEFGALYAAVESAAVFADSKVFADAIPRDPPTLILRQFQQQRPQSAAALRSFVERHFTLPEQVAVVPVNGPQPAVPLLTHIRLLWPRLVRRADQVPEYSSLLPLPQPYVVPGGRFRELYYWDSYFTLLGLKRDGRTDLVDFMVTDFAALIDRYGHVPNGTRSYYLSRSQPPVFFEMVALEGGADPAAAWARYLPQLKAEYAYWMQGAGELRGAGARERVVRLADGSLLNRYWDDSDLPRDESWREDTQLARHSGRPPGELYRDLRAAAASGWDFSSRWLADPGRLDSIRTTRIVPVDLNSLLFGLERAIESGCRRAADQACVREFARRAAARHQAMDHYLWDPTQGVYHDYCWSCRQALEQLSAATLYPLFTHVASADQARQVAAVTRARLLRPGGLATTEVRTGQQWDAPNGWAPLQWIAVRGLSDYGDKTLALDIACRWIANVSALYAHSGRLVEKYDVEMPDGGGGGEYPLQDGFGWTNGVTRELLARYPAASCRQLGLASGGAGFHAQGGAQ